MPMIIRIPLLIGICAAIVLLWYRSKRPVPQFSLRSRLAYSRTAFSKLGERVRNERYIREFPELLGGINYGRPVASTGTMPELLSTEALDQLRIRELRKPCEECGIDHTGNCADDEGAIEPTMIIPAVLMPTGELEPLPPQPEYPGTAVALPAEVSALLPSWYDPTLTVQSVSDGYDEAEREHMASLIAALKSGEPFGDVVPPYAM